MTCSRIGLGLFTGALVLGCVKRDLGDGGETTATTGGESESGGGGSSATSSGDGDPTAPTSGGPTSSPPGSSSSPPDPSAGTMTGESGEPGETGLNFLPAPDAGVGVECDLFAQDCPAGQKCAPWANDGGSAWNASKCVEVTGDQGPGEPCMAEDGGVSGEDDCIKGAMCWDVDAGGKGTCLALCTGSAEQPVCAEDEWCSISGEGVLNLCFPVCDPLAQDCAGDDLCLPVQDTFVCVFDASGDEGQAFDPCEFVNMCDPGLLCAPSESASECDPQVVGCCLPMCSISKMMPPCPGGGQECVPVFGEGLGPPEFMDVGFCSLPL